MVHYAYHTYLLTYLLTYGNVIIQLASASSFQCYTTQRSPLVEGRRQCVSSSIWIFTMSSLVQKKKNCITVSEVKSYSLPDQGLTSGWTVIAMSGRCITEGDSFSELTDGCAEFQLIARPPSEWKHFSKLRGYKSHQIALFEERMDLASQFEKKHGEDEMRSLEHRIHTLWHLPGKHLKKCLPCCATHSPMSLYQRMLGWALATCTARRTCVGTTGIGTDTEVALSRKLLR